MKNIFSVQYEKLEFNRSRAYILGFSEDDIKDIIIELIKLEYDKGKKLVFIDDKNTVAEIIKKKHTFLSLDGAKIALTENDLSLIMSFLLDATEEYMSYDHIDLELSSEDQAVEVCIKINQ